MFTYLQRPFFSRPVNVGRVAESDGGAEVRFYERMCTIVHTDSEYDASFP